MAAATAPTKHTLHAQPALIALGEVLHFMPHHTKSLRKRHVLFLLLSIAFMSTMILELAVVITRQSLNPRNLFSNAATGIPVDTTIPVRSSSGFSFAYDAESFSATVHGDGIDGTATKAELNKNKSLHSITLNPLPSRVPAAEAAAEFEVAVESDSAAFATFKTKLPKDTPIDTVTADYFAPKPGTSATVTQVSREPSTVGGSSMTKTVYQITPKFAGNPTHTIVWTAQIQGKPLSIVVRGIVAGSDVPTSISSIMSSLTLSTDAKVEGISTVFSKPAPTVIDQKYVADLASPAVVKIYHIVCGSIVFNDQAISADTCSGLSGSGFLVSSDGYIATNGHVVVYGAKDMLVNALLTNPDLLERFLGGTDMSAVQVKEVLSRADLTASVISGIFDLPNNQLRLLNQREITVAALGDTPLKVDDEASLKSLVTSFESTGSLKQATVIGYDYSAKDQLTVVADPKKGFSASDVALLKVAVTNAPFIRLSSNTITQNQKITLFGFPGDADNQLTDNTTLGVTVTNGSISSIRDAAGSESKLYQSDADASHGNSGGPAVDENGEAFGLLTYRYSSGQSGDAAKSYIRDISDFKDLMAAKKVTVNTSSTTQAAWERGLDQYSKHHYSAALSSFEQVVRLYPSHRLAGTYVDLSKQAIKDGKDVKDPSPILLIIGIGAGLGGLGLAIVLIARQHGHHRVYRAFHTHSLATVTH